MLDFRLVYVVVDLSSSIGLVGFVIRVVVCVVCLFRGRFVISFGIFFIRLLACRWGVVAKFFGDFLGLYVLGG